MKALEYLLPQPSFDLGLEKQAAFEALLAATPPGGWIDYDLDAPKWQFLSYLCRSRPLVLHGSQNLAIDILEPRKAQDVRAFSMQNAIYATTDGIWVIYFAIVDRLRFSPLTLFNSCIEIRLPGDQVMGPLYLFSVTHSALVQQPWCEGAVYILPREHFTQEASQQMMGAEIIFPHWVSPLPVQPAAKLRVTPQDFPFLAQVHGHLDDQINRLVQEDPTGFPWPEAWVV